MFWIKLIRDFLKILKEGQTPNQIAFGFALGSIVGLSPVFTLQGILIWLLIFILNVNMGAAFLSFTIFSLFAFIFDPIFHSFGYYILNDLTSLNSFWTNMYNAPVAPLTRFYNTVVMGSFVSAIILFIPVWYLMKRFVIEYRKHIYKKVEKWKIYQVINQSKFYRIYTKIRDFGGLR